MGLELDVALDLAFELDVACDLEFDLDLDLELDDLGFDHGAYVVDPGSEVIGFVLDFDLAFGCIW